MATPNKYFMKKFHAIKKETPDDDVIQNPTYHLLWVLSQQPFLLNMHDIRKKLEAINNLFSVTLLTILFYLIKYC